MSYPADLPVTAFDAERRIAAGALADVAIDVERYLARAPQARIAVFDDRTGARLELDWTAPGASASSRLGEPLTDHLAAAADPEPRRPGRPRLGVVAREVTLLPRHWEWLAAQDGGASSALRKLVDEARLAEAARERNRRAHEAAYRYMSAVGHDLPGYEDALRMLHTGDPAQFEAQLTGWPEDMRDYARRLAFPEMRGQAG